MPDSPMLPTVWLVLQVRFDIFSSSPFSVLPLLTAALRSRMVGEKDCDAMRNASRWLSLWAEKSAARAGGLVWTLGVGAWRVEVGKVQNSEA